MDHVGILSQGLTRTPPGIDPLSMVTRGYQTSVLQPQADESVCLSAFRLTRDGVLVLGLTSDYLEVRRVSRDGLGEVRLSQSRLTEGAMRPAGYLTAVRMRCKGGTCHG